MQQPNRPLISGCPGQNTWIEIQMLDLTGQPASGTSYEIELPDGSIMKGSLDDDGLARYDSIVAGTCKVRFPELESEAWDRK